MVHAIGAELLRLGVGAMKQFILEKKHHAWTLCLRIAALAAALWALYDLIVPFHK
jgi:hypothetical protein